VQIRALIDPGFAFRDYSEGLDLLGLALTQNCKVEPQNNPWSQPLHTVGTPQLPQGDLLHHKFAVIDRQTVITGSQNWSAAANHTNDEVVLVIENPQIAAHFDREFERLYENAVLGIPPTLQGQIDQDRRQCS
jgi:phosphatidylserine/phosphatidylglycerophosphate/cardiolipin synthase-like enzyme